MICLLCCALLFMGDRGEGVGRKGLGAGGECDSPKMLDFSGFGRKI